MGIESSVHEKISKEGIQAIRSLGIGGALAGLTLGFGYYAYQLLKPVIPTTGTGILEMFSIVFMLSIVAGYYFGISITESDHNYFLFFSYFLVILVATAALGVIDFGYLFVIPPVFSILLGLMVLNKNIEFNDTTGTLLHFSNNMAMGGISAIFHIIIVEPSVTPYLGKWSPITWAWVVIVFFILLVRFFIEEDL